MEQYKPEQFNQEVFKKEFGILLDTYQKDCWEFNYEARSDNKTKSSLDNLQSKIDWSMDNMVTFALQALKTSKEKESVLDRIRKMFFDTNTGNSLTPGDMTGPKVVEKFFEKIILKLL